MGHIFISNSAKNCISSKRSFAYHQGECLVYHQREADTLSVMIYAYGDDIQPVG